MLRIKQTSQSRSRIDHRFTGIAPASAFASPLRGWIKAIREGLGMSSAQLALRLGIKQPSVIALEQSEAKGSIELATLRRVAAALDCTLVYALVPNQPLETMVRERAREVLRRRRAPIEHSMLLEDQAVNAAKGNLEENEIDEFLRETRPSRLWGEP